MQPSKPKVTDLNPHLICVLCGGYFVDATTIIECLHSFCRSCIVKYLQRNKYCPICDVLVHKTRPLSNIRPDQTLQNIVYKLVPNLFQSEMTIRKEFYSRRNVLYIPRDPMSRGDVPEDYHIFGANDRIGVCLFYDCEKSDKTDIQGTYKRFMSCPVSLSILNLKRLVYLKYQLGPDDLVEFSCQNYLLDDHLTLMDIVYMFDWKRKEKTITMSFRILKIELEHLPIDEVMKEENTLEINKDNEKSKEEQNDLHNKVEVTEISVEEVPSKVEEKPTVTDKIPESKEVQLEISENGVMKITNISQSREAIQANVTIEPTDIIKNEKPSKPGDKKDNEGEDKKKTLKVYPGSKVKKTKPKLDTIVEKIKKQGTKYKTLTSPTKHWNPSISKNSVLAKKKEINGIDKKCQKFFKSRDDTDKKDEDKADDGLKRLADVHLMQINPITLCPVIPPPVKKPKKPVPKKNTLAHSLALLPVRPTNHNPFTNPLNPFMYGTFPNSSNGNPRDTNDFLKAMSELCPPPSAYHNSLPPSVSVLFNPIYNHNRQCQPKKIASAAHSPDVQKLTANKVEEKSELIEDKSNDKDKDKDKGECTNNNKGEEKMEVVKEEEKS